MSSTFIIIESSENSLAVQWLGFSESHSVVSDSLQPHGLQPTRVSVNGILQARELEWAAIPSSRGSF